MNPETHIPTIKLPGSKSISNRLLMIKAIGNIDFEIENLSDSDDTQFLKEILDKIKSTESPIDVKHTGTNMRFLCAYLSTIENKTFILTGSDRMKERPIGDLVTALRQLGADIQFIAKEGYPPLRITGKKLKGGEISLNASVSSQFITALLLISPLFKEGLKIKLTHIVVSPSYIKLTTALMRSFGIETNWTNNTISVKTTNYKSPEPSIYNESDWSAASYFYSAMALGKTKKIELSGLNKTSLQPDSIVAIIYENLGVKTEYRSDRIILHKTDVMTKHFKYDFTDCPDLAQTISVSSFGLGITGEFTGLKTLKIKETDRILALKTELEKLGATIHVSDDSLNIETISKINETAEVTIQTYNDHRMAMSFAPLLFLFPHLKIENKEVVSKSFPNFWKEFLKLSMLNK